MSSKQEISRWLDRNSIDNYIVNDDLSINVNGDVKLYDIKIETLPYKFNIIFGDFRILNCELTTLKNCPNIVYESFACSYNPIHSFNDAPHHVGGNFYCSSTPIKNLTTLQTHFEGKFYHCAEEKSQFLEDFKNYYEKEVIDCENVIFQYKVGLTMDQIKTVLEKNYLEKIILEKEELSKIVKI